MLSSTVSAVSLNHIAKPTAAASSNPLVPGDESDRAAAKAGPKADQVLREVLLFLQSAMIAGEDHVLEMGRGATFLKSPPGIQKQDIHTDFDFQTLKLCAGARRRKPLSIWIALQDDSAIFFGDRRYSYQAGDVVIFAGDCLHSGADNAASDPLFSFFLVLSYLTVQQVRGQLQAVRLCANKGCSGVLESSSGRKGQACS